jgi:hypothetical protein
MRVVAVVAVFGVAAAGCGSSKAPASTSLPSTTLAPTTTSTAMPTTTTTLGLPSALQPNAEDAATTFVAAWAAANMPKGLTVATTQAVQVLFAAPYPNGLAVNRGCSTGSAPVTCTFGPPGGGPTNDPIYQIQVSQAPQGWYVSNVQILG